MDDHHKLVEHISSGTLAAVFCAAHARGLNPFAPNEEGQTLLHAACQTFRGSADIVALLLMKGREERGARGVESGVVLTDDRGMSALMYAVYYQQIATISVLLYFHPKAVYAQEETSSLNAIEVAILLSKLRVIDYFRRTGYIDSRVSNDDLRRELRSKVGSGELRSKADIIGVALNSRHKESWLPDWIHDYSPSHNRAAVRRIASSTSFAILLTSMLIALAFSCRFIVMKASCRGDDTPWLLHALSISSQLFTWAAYISVVFKEATAVETHSGYTYEDALSAIYHNKYNCCSSSSKAFVCHVCRIYRPFRSGHSGASNTCIKMYDHFCYFLARDIGAGNYRHFFVFVALLALLATPVFLYLSTRYLAAMLAAVDRGTALAPMTLATHFDLVFLLCFFFWTALVWIMLLLFLGYHVVISSRGLTTWEDSSDHNTLLYLRPDKSSSFSLPTATANLKERLSDCSSSGLVLQPALLRGYSFRSLGRAELAAFYDLCAVGFSAKPRPPPAAYFRKHFENDPWREHRSIFVAEERASRRLVASVRLFVRPLFYSCGAAGAPVTELCGGVGEVCTLKAHVRQGLSSQLLLQLLDSAKKRGFSRVILHAAEAYRGFYARFAFRSLLCEWSLVQVPRDNSDDDGIWAVDEIVICDHAKRMSELSRAVSSLGCGSVMKTEEYVRRWLGGDGGCAYGLFSSSSSGDRCLVAYAILGERQGRAQLRDLGMEQQPASTGGPMLLRLLGAALQRSRSAAAEVAVPAPVVAYLALPSQPGAAEDGWMQLRLHPSPRGGGSDEGAGMMFWPVDSF